jgi:hypothetical protein
MSAILRDDSVIEPMVSTTCDTTVPPFSATDDADTASWLAWRALSAFCFTVEVSSSIDDAVSSSELACDSVRADRSALPEAISCEAVEISSVPVRTSPTVLARLSFMSLSACSSSLVSSLPSTTTCEVSSPAATFCATPPRPTADR